MENQLLNKFQLAALLFGVLIVSFGVLAFEIALTRIFSIMLDYHYTFLVVSLALFGLSLGGVLASRFTGKTSVQDNLGRLALLVVTFSLSMAFLTLFAISHPNLDMAIQVILMFLPFLLAGTILAIVYKLFVSHSSVLHFADLAGAAAGSLLVIFLINWTGAIASVLLVSVATLGSAFLFSVASKRKLAIAATLLAILGLGVFAQFSGTSGMWNIMPASHQGKELAEYVANPAINARIVDSRWTSFGQVELVESPAMPHQKFIFVDGGAGTGLFHFDGDLTSDKGWAPALRNTTMYFPYYFTAKDRSLVIGPGGGIDVLTALAAGVKQIDAVEVNPGIVDLVKDNSAYDGGLYTNYSNVRITIDDGRSFVKRSNQTYDVIMIDIPLTKTSQGTLGYSLAENYLFTTDSFADYLNHLNDDGYLTIVAHNQDEIYKLYSISFQALSAQGLSPQQISERIAVVGSGNMMDHSTLPVFMLKKTAINQSEALEITSVAHKKGFKNLFSPLTLFDPSYDSTSMDHDHALMTLAKGNATFDKALLASAPLNLQAPTDDSPFFYNMDLGVPATLATLLLGAIVLCITVSVTYVAARRRDVSTVLDGASIKLKSRFSAFKWYCFASLGFGFMLLEVALIQKFILFLGEPTLAIAVSLFSLLLAGGLGSYFSRKWSIDRQRNAFTVSLLVAALAIAYIFVLPVIFNATLSYPTALRFLVSFVLISPLGFLMGIPFPTILGYIKEEADNDAAWMWCINGAFSVLAGVLALVLAMAYGFNSVLLLGALTYAGLFVAGMRYEQKRKKDEKDKEAEVVMAV